jgi:hypothetical protein
MGRGHESRESRWRHRTVRGVLNLLTTLSLLLCVTLAFLWYRSYWRWDLWRAHPDERRYYTVVFETGGFTVDVTTYDRPTDDRRFWGRGWNWNRNGRAPLRPVQPVNFWNRQGFYWSDVSHAPSRFGAALVREQFVTVPAWLPTLLTAIAPSAWLVARLRRRARFGRGHCTGCGYDLTGNVSGVCPECGTEAPSLRREHAA